MAYSISTRSPARLMTFLFFCNCLTQAIPTRRSVCGSGPHSFDETGLDVYVLPHSNVTLQATPYQRATRVIDWSSTLKKSWITNKIAQRGTKLIVGPMDKALNLLSLRYYIQRGGSNSESIELFSSNTVTLYLAATDLDMFPDKGFEIGQNISVTDGSLAQLVYCFKLAPQTKQDGGHIPPSTIVLKKEVPFLKEFRALPSNRYHIDDGCVWIKSLRKEDSGKYSLQIRTCFSFQSELEIGFSLTVRQASASFHTVAVNEPRIETIKKREIRSANKSQLGPEITLTLVSGQKNTTSAAGVLTIFASFKDNVTLLCRVTGMDGIGRMSVFHKDTKNRTWRVGANITETLLEIVNVGHSDNGTYVVKVKRKRVTANTTFTLEVEEKLVTKSTSVSARPSTSPNRNSVNPTRELTQITSRTTSTRPSGSLNNKIHTEGWFIFIIVFCILLVIIIPTVYCSYKHRQSLRRRCCYLAPKSENWNSSDIAIPNYSNISSQSTADGEVIRNDIFQSSNPVFSTIRSTQSTSTEDPNSLYTNTKFPATGDTNNDVVSIGQATKQHTETVPTHKENTDLPLVISTTNEDSKQQEAGHLYDVLASKEKKTDDNSSSRSQEKTTEESVAVSKDQLVGTEQKSLYAEVRKRNANKAQKTSQSSEADGQFVEDPNPDDKESTKIQAETPSQSVLYAAVVKSKQKIGGKDPVQLPSSLQVPNRTTQEEKSQDVEMKTAAVSKWM